MTSQIDIDCRHYGDRELGTALIIDILKPWKFTLPVIVEAKCMLGCCQSLGLFCPLLVFVLGLVMLL